MAKPKQKQKQSQRQTVNISLGATRPKRKYVRKAKRQALPSIPAYNPRPIINFPPSVIYQNAPVASSIIPSRAQQIGQNIGVATGSALANVPASALLAGFQVLPALAGASVATAGSLLTSGIGAIPSALPYARAIGDAVRSIVPERPRAPDIPYRFREPPPEFVDRARELRQGLIIPPPAPPLPQVAGFPERPVAELLGIDPLVPLPVEDDFADAEGEFLPQQFPAVARQAGASVLLQEEQPPPPIFDQPRPPATLSESSSYLKALQSLGNVVEAETSVLGRGLKVSDIDALYSRFTQGGASSLIEPQTEPVATPEKPVPSTREIINEGGKGRGRLVYADDGTPISEADRKLRQSQLSREKRLQRPAVEPAGTATGIGAWAGGEPDQSYIDELVAEAEEVTLRNDARRAKPVKSPANIFSQRTEGGTINLADLLSLQQQRQERVAGGTPNVPLPAGFSGIQGEPEAPPPSGLERER